MKQFSIFFSLLLAFDAHSQDWHAAWSMSGTTWSEKWTNTLDRLAEFTDFQQIEILSSAVRVGKEPSNLERQQIFQRAQLLFLSFPNYAKYLVDQIERERASVEHLPANVGTRGNYDTNRRLRFETMALIPSPEIIKVLGDYLADERDHIELPVHDPKQGISCTSGGSSGNSTHSAQALEKSFLRDKPYRVGSLYDILQVKTEWRIWWEEVKSGRRTFSFIGQKVEYRFKPDGTWDTIPIANPPDDAPGRRDAGAADRPVKRPQPTPLPEKQSPQGSSWAWIIGALIAGLGGVFWLGMRKVPR